MISRRSCALLAAQLMPLALLLALLAACSRTPGEVMLVIDSDLTPGGSRPDFDAFQIGVTFDHFVSPLFNEFGAPGLPVSFPATFAIIGNGDPTLNVQIRLYAGLLPGETAVGQERLLREAVTTIPEDEIVMLRLPFEWSCYGNAYDKGPPDHYVEAHCEEGTTCIAGTCVEWSIDSAKLPLYSESAVFGGACFDTVACLSHGSTVALDRASCTIPKPAETGAGINVAIISADGHGVCDEANRCYVPLDADAVRGWSEDGATLKLPPGYCAPAEGIAPDRIRDVIVSTACASKTESTPTCGPWSAVGK